MDCCWYCGTTEATAYEWEHQLPLSRGGVGKVQVRSCRRCNRIKGSDTLEEYRQRLSDILRYPVVFAGEVAPGEPFSCDMAEVERVLAAQTVVRLSGVLSEEIRDAYWHLRGRGVYMTILDIVERGLRMELAGLRRQFNDEQPFPPYRPAEQLSLLDDGATGATETTGMTDS
jgi:hypothetical protein